MRGRTLARYAATAQALLLAGALIVPSSVAAATVGFSLNAPSASTVHYSDLVTLRGAYTCVNDASSNCPTTLQTSTATFSLRPSGGSTFLQVGQVTTSWIFTGSAGGCPTTCSQQFSISYKAGRAGVATLAPGVYDIGLTTTFAAGQQVSLGGLTITQEGTTTTNGGLLTGLGDTSLALSATIADLDRGLSAGTGIYSPDTNLFGAGLVTFALYDSTNTTLLGGPVSATLLASGVTTGSPTLLLPASGGSLRLRTTFVGNSFYTTSADLDTITVTPSNTPPVLTVPAGPIVEEATSPAGAVVNFVVTAADAEDNPDPAPTCDWDSGDTFPIGGTTVHCSVTDSGGLGDSDSFTVTVQDTTDPSVSISTGESIGASGWYNIASNDGSAGVTIDVVVSDAVSAVSLACTDNGEPLAGTLDPGGDSFVLGDGQHVIACAATDAAGNSAGDTAGFDIDQTAPSLGPTVSPDPAGTGWWNAGTGAPTVTWSCEDNLPGVACAGPETLGEGEDQVAAGWALDAAGNETTGQVADLDVDLTGPSVTPVVTPSAAASGWWNASTGAPTVSFLCSDAVSGVTCAGSTTLGEGADQSVPYLVTDNAGNAAAGSVDDLDVDLTAPEVTGTLAPAAAGSGWWNIATGAPTMTFSCSDAGSGVASCPAAFAFGEGAAQSHDGTAFDVAGNSATAAIAGVDVDLAAPTAVAFTGGGIAPGGAYVFGSVPAGPTGCTASDSLSGVATCSVSGYSTAVGSHTLVALATDAAGNAATATRAYTVLPWTLAGFANPISMTSPNLVKGGSNVNLRFEVFAGTAELTSLDAVTGILQTQVACGSPLFVGAPSSALSTRGSSLKYDTTSGQYIAKFDAPTGSGTCWLISVVTADGSSLSAFFTIK